MNGTNPEEGISGPAPGGSRWGAKILPLLPGGIKVINMGGGYYQLDFPAITQTGANVVTTHIIPFPHKLISMFVKHVDSNLADAATSLTFSAKFSLRDNLNFALASFTSVAPDELFAYNNVEGARNATTVQFNTNTTNTHLVYISMIVQALGGI